MNESAEKTWRDYYERKRAEKAREAQQMWQALAAAGASPETVLAIDFEHACPDRPRAEELGKQLAENYTIELQPAADGYWAVRGTTRPYGVTLSPESHLGWVGFMCDVAQSYGGVFAAWSLSAPALGFTVSSETIDGGG
jgi:hypothetical protein